MGINQIRVGRTAILAVVLGAIVTTVNGACVVESPDCMAHCFEYTVEYEVPVRCKDDFGFGYDISFTGSDPDGYYGRWCFNGASGVIDTINYLRNGGELSGLNMSDYGAYEDAVQQIGTEIRFECELAAPGQCTNEVSVCAGIGADSYAQLITNETCILEPSGVGNYYLGSSEVCEFIPVGYGTGEAETDGFCTGPTTSGGGADETTGAMSDPPFGDIQELVSCNPQTECDVESELLSNISANFDVFDEEGVTLEIVDGTVSCGPGAQIGGLDSGEDAKELADAFDFRNGDVIRVIESVTIDDLDDALVAVSSLLEDPSTTIVIRRPTQSGCDTISYDIDVI